MGVEISLAEPVAAMSGNTTGASASAGAGDGVAVAVRVDALDVILVCLPTAFHPQQKNIHCLLQDGMEGLNLLSNSLPDTEAGKIVKKKLGSQMDQMNGVRAKLHSFKGFIVGFERSFVDEMIAVHGNLDSFGPAKKMVVKRVTARRLLKNFENLMTQVDVQIGKLSSGHGEMATLTSAANDVQVVTSSAQEGSFFEEIMSVMPCAASARAEVDGRMPELRRKKKEAVDKILTDLTASKEMLGRTNGEFAAVVGKIEFLNDKIQGSKKSVSETQKMAQKLAQDATSKRAKAAEEIKTEKVAVFGFTLKSWEVEDPGANAIAAQYMKMQKEHESRAEAAAKTQEQLQTDLEEAEKDKSTLEQRQKDLQDGVKRIEEDLKLKVDEMREHEEALIKLAKDFPGFHPTEVAKVAGLFDNLAKMVGDAAKGKGFVEVALGHLQWLKGKIEGVHGVLKEAVEDDEVLEVLGEVLPDALLDEKYRVLKG